MADIVDVVTRSRMMAGIRGRDTLPERILRAAMHRAGFRYRLNVKSLPGKPDLAFSKYRAVVFVQGCFWHRHLGCVRAATPSSNRRFWQQKFKQNVARDRRNEAKLRQLGWRVATVWECAITRTETEKLSRTIGTWLIKSTSTLEIPKRRRE
ncbi:MAG: DNA mismatch endonuclease Vsr [Acidobacteria bacterium]|nr:DNA mismatch endonuclease Vsr [Acidobacteriota bacterium]